MNAKDTTIIRNGLASVRVRRRARPPVPPAPAPERQLPVEQIPGLDIRIVGPLADRIRAIARAAGASAAASATGPDPALPVGGPSS